MGCVGCVFFFFFQFSPRFFFLGCSWCFVWSISRVFLKICVLGAKICHLSEGPKSFFKGFSRNC